MSRYDIFKQDLISAGEQFADAFSLPKDMVVNATLFHMIGASELLVENFKGIISYTCHEIMIKGNNVKYCVSGECLMIEYYSDDDMKISGRIKEVKVIA
jgi:sporulation protein YqfC